MRQLIHNSISWNKLSQYSKDMLIYEVGDVVFYKKTKALTISMTLNFVIPLKDVNKISDHIKSKIPYVSEVLFEFKYENVIMNENDIVFFYIDYLFDFTEKNYSYLTKTIKKQNYIYDNNVLTIKAFGDKAVSEMNRLISPALCKQVSANFGIEISIVFKNCSETYQKRLAEKEKEKVEERIAVVKEAPKEPEKKSEKISRGSVLGKAIKDATVKIRSINNEYDVAVIEGQIFDKKAKDLKSGKKMIILLIADGSDSICAKSFLTEEKFGELDGNISVGDHVRLKGNVSYDNFEKCIVIIAKDIEKVQVESRMDTSKEKRIELHAHTKMSSMDGLIEVKELVKKAAKWGHKAVAVTDHGVVQAFPDAMDAAKKNGIKVIYGMEGYVIDDGDSGALFPENLTIDSEYVVFDIETTGLSAVRDEIIEIGAVKVKDRQITDSFHTFIKPGRKLSPEIVDLTGITDEMLANAPKLDDIFEDFLNYVGDLPLVAHNAQFDVSFIKESCKRRQLSLHNPVVDTLYLSRIILKDLKKHKLNIVAAKLGIQQKNHHRADDDAATAAQIMIKLFNILEEKGIKELQDIGSLIDQGNYKNLKSYHIMILVKNDEGLRNLYKMVSISHMQYFYKKPRIPKSLLRKHREGLIIGSACEAGEVYQSILNEFSDQDIKKIASFYDYFEVQPLSNNEFLLDEGRLRSRDDLIEINKKIIALGDEQGKLVVATSDAHYIEPEEAIYRGILMAGQGYKDVEGEGGLYLRTTDEMLEEFSYLDEETRRNLVIINPEKIAEQVESILPVPSGTFPPYIEGSEELLNELCWGKARSIYGDPLPEIVEKRLQRELNSIISNGYAVMYIIAQKLVAKSLEDGYLVGSRGSVGSSFAATMSGITEVNPLPPHYVCPSCKTSEFITDGSYSCGVDMPEKICPVCGHDYIKDGFDIPFEVFLGFEGDKEPDIDLNFAGEYQGNVHKYTEVLFGKDHVYRAGTIGTVAFKTAFGFVKKYYEEKGELVSKWETERLSNCCTGIKRTTGQHPGGVMIVPHDREIYEFTPIQYPANDVNSGTITTHFDYHSISGRLLKLDILGHDVPTMIRMLQDMTGIEPWDVPLKDSKVDSIFHGIEALEIKESEYRYNLGSLGIPEFGTRFVRQMLVDTDPSTFSDLVRIAGLSHGTNVWINNAQEFILNGVATIKDVISTRDDIMNYLIHKGVPNKMSFKIMESVRKGKGVSDEQVQVMQENNVPAWYIESCRRIEYMFPKAHAVAYVMMSYRIAYYKVYYPLEFYAVFLSMKVSEFDAETILKGRHAVEKKIQMIEDKGNTAVQKEKDELTVLEVVYEMYSRGFEFKPVDIYESEASVFKVADGKVLLPFLALSGVGENAAKAIVREREFGEFISVDDMKNRAGLNKTAIEALDKQGVTKSLPDTNQLSLFWG